MKTTTPSCSALAQNGWNFGSLISSPATLPPMPAARRPYFLTPSSSCWAARSGCCSATVAKATKRSGCAAHASASFSFCSLMSWLATSRSALYQYGLMLSASTSMPCSSIARIRSDACLGMVRGLWPLAVVGAFVVGWAAAGAGGRTTAARDTAHETEHLKQQVSTLQARLHAREELAAARAAASSPAAPAPSAPRASGDRG